jgi:hypothetical protein
MKEMGSRVSAKALIGAVGLALAVSACGGQVKMGAAATYDDGRISTASLDDAVSSWNKEFTKTPSAGLARQQTEQAQSGAVPWDSTNPSRSTLQQLLNIKVWDEVAVQQGITITDTEVDKTVQDNGGARFLQIVPLAVGLPESKARDYAREVAIQKAVLTNSGEVVGAQLTQQQYNLLATAYSNAIKALKIKVNPRYGNSFPLLSTSGQVTYSLSKADPGLSGAS